MREPGSYNLIINWQRAEDLDRDYHLRKRYVTEAIWMHKTKGAMNRDECNYDLSHTYDDVI